MSMITSAEKCTWVWVLLLYSLQSTVSWVWLRAQKNVLEYEYSCSTVYRVLFHEYDYERRKMYLSMSTPALQFTEYCFMSTITSAEKCTWVWVLLLYSLQSTVSWVWLRAQKNVLEYEYSCSTVYRVLFHEYDYERRKMYFSMSTPALQFTEYCFMSMITSAEKCTWVWVLQLWIPYLLVRFYLLFVWKSNRYTCTLL